MVEEGKKNLITRPTCGPTALFINIPSVFGFTLCLDGKCKGNQDLVDI